MSIFRKKLAFQMHSYFLIEMWKAKTWAIITLVFVSSANDLIALWTMYLFIKTRLLKGKSRLRPSHIDRKALGDQTKVQPGS